MTTPRSKLRRSAERAGPIVIALLLGVVLVASSALSYRDAKGAAVVVAERQGIGFLHRLERALGRGPVRLAEVQAALDANRPLGLTYIGVFDRRTLIAEVGQPLLSASAPVVGAPAFGHRRVRMVAPGRRESQRWPEAPEAPQAPQSPHPLVIEFEPIASEDALRRALTVLVLSCGAGGLLALAALISWRHAHRAELAELRHSSQRHLAQLGEMSAVLAHEIRNPLASLKGHAQLLAEKVDDRALAARVDRVIEEAVRLEHLTNDLLDFARSGAIRAAPASPADVLERASLATNPQRIDRSSHAGPPTWQLDAARIEQVLINLLENALAVTPMPLRVGANISRDRGALVFTIRDHGPGVPGAERALIFEPFHTTKLRGTGLGLSVAKRIVELHGGRIDVVDAVGGGAQFRVYIPARDTTKP